MSALGAGTDQGGGKRFADRVVLVTGAGQGLGRAVATALAAEGATLVLHGRDVGKLEKLYDEVTATGGEAAIAALDFERATDKDFAALAHEVERGFGRLDGLVHCAVRGARPSPLANQSLDDWLALLRVNLAAPFALTRALLPALKRADDAAVVFTLDSHAQRPAAYWGGFAVAKAGLAALVQIFAQELEILPKLRVNAIVPGPIASPQRALTHPGEEPASRRPLATVIPYYLEWLGPESRGRSGQIVEC